MKTEKLYEKDAYISSFEANVLSVLKENGVYKAVLDKTAFFPEGGGQPSDIGLIDGAAVNNVQIENGEIYHYTEAELKAGQTVFCEVDFERRYNFMQNHTAEHIVSGLVHKKFGFDNIGFHLSETLVTFDFNGFFTSGQLEEIEAEANKRVWSNLSVTAFYPSADELQAIPYRSKDGIEGEIRLVQIENTDICACCAPHVKSTGEIGIIKFLSTEKQHGGTRIFMKCGGFALRDYGKKNADIKAVCELLSAKTDEVRQAVYSLSERLESEKLNSKDLSSELLGLKIKMFDNSKSALVLNNAEIKELQMAADGLHKTYGGAKTALSKTVEGAFFAMCADESEIEAEFERLKQTFTVKGGGRGPMRQGSIVADFDKIKEYFGV